MCLSDCVWKRKDIFLRVREDLRVECDDCDDGNDHVIMMIMMTMMLDGMAGF
jgi:hypothetical protein